eukprot:5210437-Alexandrium_andersonii.AAC.1
MPPVFVDLPRGGEGATELRRHVPGPAEGLNAHLENPDSRVDLTRSSPESEIDGPRWGSGRVNEPGQLGPESANAPGWDGGDLASIKGGRKALATDNAKLMVEGGWHDSKGINLVADAGEPPGSRSVDLLSPETHMSPQVSGTAHDFHGSMMATVGHALEGTPDTRPTGQHMTLGDLSESPHVGE